MRLFIANMGYLMRKVSLLGAPSSGALQKENAEYILQEDGSFILLE